MMSKNPAAVEPGKGESKHHCGELVYQCYVVSFQQR